MNKLDYIAFLKNKGIVYSDSVKINSDEDYLNVTLLNKQDTLSALELLKKLDLIVLGGDVFVKDGDNYLPDYANWYFNDEIGDNLNFYVNKSYEIAKNFVSNYKEKSNKETFYLLVVDN